MKLSPLIVAFLAVLPACGGRLVIRDAETFVAEHASSLARETEAADRLLDAATFALMNGDEDRCVLYAETALLIEAKAQPQHYRALWLAGLPYPSGDYVPPLGTEQPDPGAAPAPEDPETICPSEVPLDL